MIDEDESNDIKIARMDENITFLKNGYETLVTRKEFVPVRNIAYGAIGLMAMLIVGIAIARAL